MPTLPLFPARFTATVHTFDVNHNTLVVHYLPIPPAVAADLKARRLRRLTGTLNGQPFNLALHNHAGHDERFLLLSRGTMRTLKAAAGSPIAVVCQPDEAPDEVALPEELQEVFNQDPEAEARFVALTPGRRRSLVHYVSSAKGLDTRVNRAVDLARKLRTNTLYGDLNPPKERRA